MQNTYDRTYRVLATNLGSTSTKVAYFENEECVVSESLTHDSAQLVACASIWDQLPLRLAAVEDFMARHGIALDALDAISDRGGQSEPIEGGVYLLNEPLRAQNKSGEYGVHVGNIGFEIAHELAARSAHAIAVTVDISTTDELSPLARYSGLPEIPRESRLQVLNHKAMARAWAESQGRSYEDVNLVVAMLGGGITVAAHECGRMIDAPDGLEGDGCFANDRCNGVPAGALVKLCYSGAYTEEEMLRHINGEAGLRAYVGETDVRALTARAEAGDARVAEVLDAMCYQASKEIAACASALRGKVDAVLLTGGMANSSYLVERIRERVSFVGPIAVMPGEREMESLGVNAVRALAGHVPLREFVPTRPVDLSVLDSAQEV